MIRVVDMEHPGESTVLRSEDGDASTSIGGSGAGKIYPIKGALCGSGDGYTAMSFMPVSTVAYD